MRKLSAYILIALLLVSGMGCSASGEHSGTPQLPAKFDSDFNADYGDLKLSGHISKRETGIYTITMTEPKTLESICFSYIGGKITASLDGISFDAEVENLPASGFVKNVVNSIDTASNSGIVAITKAKGYNRYCVSNDACILQEQANGHISSLSIESVDISMNFIDFKTN